jgi:plastocyanin
MRLSSSVLTLLVVAGVAACGGGGTEPNPNDVAFLYIMRNGAPADSTVNLDALGPVQLGLLALNSARVELVPGKLITEWRSTDPSVATVSDSGLVTPYKDGTTYIVVREQQVFDSVRLVVHQQATRVRTEQDTVVALTSTATAVGNSTLADRTLQFVTYTTDRAGFRIASDSPITYVDLDPALLTITPNAHGDTVRVLGSAVGVARIERHFEGYTDTMHVQIADHYAVVSLSTTLSGTVISPTSLTVAAGTAVVFSDLESSSFSVVGSGWSAGPIPGNKREAQLFMTAGTYNYSVGNGTGTVIVTP